MRATLLILVLLLPAINSGAGPSPDVRAIQPGSIVVGGNVIDHAESLTVANGRIYQGDIQVWPAVPRRSTPAVRVDSLTERQHWLHLAVRSSVDSIQEAAPNGGMVAERYVSAYRQHPDLVDSAWVDPKSGMPWVKWKNSFPEEILIGPAAQGSEPLTDLATSTAELWRWALRQGCIIFVGDGYQVTVPPQRQRIEYFKRNMARMIQSGDSAQLVPRDFRQKNGAIARDLKDPQPLNVLQTRR